MTRKPRTVLERALEAASDQLRRPATQKDVAKLAEVKQPSVSDWRVSTPSMNTAVIFCRNTRVSVNWFLLEDGPKTIAPPNNPKIERLLRLWPHISEFTQGRIIQMAEEDAHGPQSADRRRRMS